MMDAKTLADEIEQQITDNPYIAKTVMLTGEKWRAVISFLRPSEQELPSGMAMAMDTARSMRDAIIDECAKVCESRAGIGSYAESMAAHRILTSAADAIRDLKASGGDSQT